MDNETVNNEKVRDIDMDEPDEMINNKSFAEETKDWVVRKLSKNNMDAIVIDNWYSKDEIKKVFTEFDYYMNNGLDNLIQSERDKSSARGKDGNSLARTYRFYIEPTIYSALYKYNQKYMHAGFKEMVETKTSFGGFMTNTRRNSMMVNYYENDKYYKSHRDVSVITQLTWLYREPKMFRGGDLIFTDMDETIDCVSNRTVFFPGYYKHEVTSVNMNDEWEGEYKDKDYYGRFSIANFFYN